MSDDLEKFVQTWTIDVRHEQARQARQSSHWQKQLAVDEARFSGLLVDLHENARTIALAMSSGRQVSGTIRDIGSNFVAIDAIEKSTVYLRLDVITSVEVDGRANSVGTPSERTIDTERRFEDVIAELAERHAAVRFATRNTKELRAATLMNAGVDVVTLELSTNPPRTLFVATEHLSEIAAL